jgi:hypothetical protein
MAVLPLRKLVTWLSRRSLSGRVKQALTRQLMSDVEREAALIFNAEFYVASNPDVAAAGVDPLAHYLSHGMAEERRPSPLFDPDYYRDHTPDAVAPSLRHFLQVGGAAGYNPIEVGFDSAWYLARHPEVRRGGLNPLVHYLRRGRSLGYDPSPHFSARWYARQYPDVAASGLEPLTHYLWHGYDEGHLPSPGGARWAPQSRSVAQVLTEQSRSYRALPVRPVAHAPRITVVTDTFDLTGPLLPVGTAVGFAAVWAQASGRSLRILTRVGPPQAVGLEAFLDSIGVGLPAPVEVVHCPTEGEADLVAVSPQDGFVTTCWWHTRALTGSVAPGRVVYLLSDDERAFYPVGSTWLRAAEAMSHPDLSLLVSTPGLLEHLGATGVGQLGERALAFTPSLAPVPRPGRRLADRGSRPIRLGLFARPSTPRYLYDDALAGIDQAISRGWVPEGTQVMTIGSQVEPAHFVDESSPLVTAPLAWPDYRDRLATIDLGVCLAASPHPGALALDLLAAGAVVVTNRWPGKPSLGWASRAVEVAPGVADLVEGIRRGFELLRQVEDQPYQPEDVDLFGSWTDNLRAAAAWAEARVACV